MGLMEAVFYILPGIFVVVGVFGVVKTLRRSSRISRTWRHGRTAEARCLRSYTTTSGGGETPVTTTLRHVYEFRTAEGRVVRFNEASGSSTVIEGDFVTVYYLPEDPSGATARPPAQGKLAAGTGCIVAFFVVFTLFALGFMGVAHFIFSATGDLAP
ncbi:DUF3592 domain-containing protein [Streptomyces sp. NPDC059629]|uniref:DUF3592 domain-containing protein n=1 Tax=Streptomyces sp. NPDC059629 TaxID=3346889 RepID=UPI0036795843